MKLKIKETIFNLGLSNILFLVIHFGLRYEVIAMKLVVQKLKVKKCKSKFILFFIQGLGISKINVSSVNLNNWKKFRLLILIIETNCMEQ